MSKSRQKIVVGISGGVDSSVAAYLLKREGHDVHGVFIKTWSPEWLPCTWVEEKRDAMRVCAALDIPFHFLDAEAAYKQGVADYMIAEYRAGRTPNPDVLCNRVIKFGVLWEFARSLGADAIATGHYARIEYSDILKNVRVLQRGADPDKDQSYFLWMLGADELAHIRFPIGHLHKAEVRSSAQRAGLFTAEKKDSQGICFLGDVDMKEFLAHYIEQRPGPVIDTEGTVIGEHDGVWFYTIGERHGFRITHPSERRTPYYVVDKDVERNTLVVASQAVRAERAKKKNTVTLRDQQWIEKPKTGKRYSAQVRYHGACSAAKRTKDGTIELAGNEPLPLGQSLVLYDGDRLMGGGIVEAVA